MPPSEWSLKPAALLVEYFHLLTSQNPPGPILDLACGRGQNGVFLARQKLEVICCDRSQEALDHTGRTAAKHGVDVRLWKVDLEKEGMDPLPKDSYGAILVFRYLHRPLIPFIKKALRNEGLLFYETFTIQQPKFGKPRNPSFLLKPGELLKWFKDWHLHHYFEGTRQSPERAVAQLVCRKCPSASA